MGSSLVQVMACRLFVTKHYADQCWHVAHSQKTSEEFEWKWKKDAAEHAVCKMGIILFRPQCFNYMISFNGLWLSDAIWDIDPGQYWSRKWLAAWQHQAIIWTNVDLSSNVFCGIHMRVISQLAFMNWMCKMRSDLHVQNSYHIAPMEQRVCSANMNEWGTLRLM